MNGLVSTADNHLSFSGKVGGAREVFEGHPWVLVGGCMFKLKQLPLYPNGILPAGTPIYVDEQARTFDVHYAFSVYESASAATEIKIAKGLEGSRVQEDMFLMAAQTNIDTAAGAAPKVVAVDRTNEAYDIVTLDAALTVTAGAVLWEANDQKKIKVKPNALTSRDKVRYADTYMVDGDAIFGADGAVLERRIPPISPAVKKYMRENECFFRWSNHK